MATVSRVLNDDPAVAGDTRENVLRVIAQVGYAPNALGRSLRKNSTRRILLLLPSISHEFLSGVARGRNGRPFAGVIRLSAPSPTPTQTWKESTSKC